MHSTQAPSLARSFVTVLPPPFVTQIFAPSKAIKREHADRKRAGGTPSLARSFVTCCRYSPPRYLPRQKRLLGEKPTANVP